MCFEGCGGFQVDWYKDAVCCSPSTGSTESEAGCAAVTMKRNAEDLSLWNVGCLLCCAAKFATVLLIALSQDLSVNFQSRFEYYFEYCENNSGGFVRFGTFAGSWTLISVKNCCF